MNPLSALIILSGLLLSFPVIVIADESVPAASVNPTPSRTTQTQINIEGLSSPRATMQTFIQTMKRVQAGDTNQLDKAALCLDLSEINPLIRPEKGRDLVRLLFEILNRTGKVKLWSLPSRTSGPDYHYHKYKNGTLSLAQQTDGRWLFSRDSLRLLPQLLEELPENGNYDQAKASHLSTLPWYIRFREKLPNSLKESWFGLELWKWLGLLTILATGIVIDQAIAWILTTTLNQWRNKTHNYELPARWLRPLGYLAMTGIWWLGLNLLGLPDNILVVLLVAVKIMAGLMATWSACRILDFIFARMTQHARYTANKLDDVLVPLGRKVIRTFVTVIGGFFIASTLNINITGLVAGLGLGGLAFALAAKDMVQNVFGSITILMDQTFHVGDWVIIDDIEGTVEEVGLRSTRIRTFYNSEVTLPNSRLITASVDNMGKRRYRRMKCDLGLIYNTPPEKIETFCEAIRELVRLHPYMRKDYYQVYLNKISAASLDVMVYVFFEAPDWSTELREKQRFLLDILRIAQQMDIEFAYPTHTVYWNQTEENHDEQTANDDDAHAIARSVVAASTGIGKKPPPVVIPKTSSA